jgi:CHASE2 domain-containing sensor protein
MLGGMHNALQSAITDMRFGWFARQASGHVVLVAIDSPSIEKIGVWPWPRRLHAELIERLENAGASDIVFDVDFSSQSDPAFDRAFADALQRAGGSVVLQTFKQLVADGKNGTSIHANRPLPEFGKHAWSAVVNVPLEPDGLVRRYSFGETLDGVFVPSVGALLASRYERNQKPLQIDFSISADLLPTVSYVDVLRGDPDVLKMFKNKKVIIGATALELGDRFNVPNGRVIPGPVLQMLAAESILQNRVLRTSSAGVTLGGLGFIVLLMMLLWSSVSAGLRFVVLVAIAGGVEVVAILLQSKLPVIVDTSPDLPA